MFLRVCQCIEARSKPTTLRDLLKQNGMLSPILPEASVLHDAKYSGNTSVFITAAPAHTAHARLDHRGWHDCQQVAAALKYDVHLTLTDDAFVVKNGDKRITVTTLLTDKMERFVDCGGTCDNLPPQEGVKGW